jgi:hypothetical protein
MHSYDSELIGPECRRMIVPSTGGFQSSYLRLEHSWIISNILYRQQLGVMASRKATSLFGSTFRAGSTSRIAPTFRRGIATASRSGPGVNRAILALGALALPVSWSTTMELMLISRRTCTTIAYTSIKLLTQRKSRPMISPQRIPINHKLLVKVKVNPVDQAKRVRSKLVMSSPRRRVMKYGW